MIKKRWPLKKSVNIRVMSNFCKYLVACSFFQEGSCPADFRPISGVEKESHLILLPLADIFT